MTEEATQELKPFRFELSFLQELDGIVLAKSKEEALEDIKERGGNLPQFKLVNLEELTQNEYTTLLLQHDLGIDKGKLN